MIARLKIEIESQNQYLLVEPFGHEDPEYVFNIFLA
jgi:hypothetical protein